MGNSSRGNKHTEFSLKKLIPTDIIEFPQAMVLASREFWSDRNVIIKLVAIWRVVTAVYILEMHYRRYAPRERERKWSVRNSEKQERRETHRSEWPKRERKKTRMVLEWHGGDGGGGEKLGGALTKF